MYKGVREICWVNTGLIRPDGGVELPLTLIPVGTFHLAQPRL